MHDIFQCSIIQLQLKLNKSEDFFFFLQIRFYHKIPPYTFSVGLKSLSDTTETNKLNPSPKLLEHFEYIGLTLGCFKLLQINMSEGENKCARRWQLVFIYQALYLFQIIFNLYSKAGLFILFVTIKYCKRVVLHDQFKFFNNLAFYI